MIGPGGVVKDLVVSADITTATYTGGVAYNTYGTIEGMRVYGSLNNDESLCTAGIVVESFKGSVIRACANYARVTGRSGIAGIAHGNGGTLESCANYGDIVLTTGRGGAGGMVSGGDGYFR